MKDKGRRLDLHDSLSRHIPGSHSVAFLGLSRKISISNGHRVNGKLSLDQARVRFKTMWVKRWNMLTDWTQHLTEGFSSFFSRGIACMHMYRYLHRHAVRRPVRRRLTRVKRTRPRYHSTPLEDHNARQPTCCTAAGSILIVSATLQGLAQFSVGGLKC